MDTLLTAVVVVDPELCIRYMNPAAESLFGISSARAEGQAPAFLVYDDGSDVFGVLSRIYTSGLTLTRRAAEFRTRQGQEVTADLSVSLDPIGDRLIIELQPISRLVRISRDERARSSFRTTRELIRGLAHEIKNPLGGLRGAAQLLERELADPEHIEYTQVIIREADRLTELVDRLLGPKGDPSTGTFNIHRILEHVIRLVEAEFPERLDIQRDYDPSLPGLSGDADQMIQAILNMVRNAAQSLTDSSNAAPRILIRTRVVRSFTIAGTRHRLVARIDIVDNGPGIDESLIEEIFYPMITTRAHGNGLGLAVTQAVVGRHGGVVECHSQPGETCFSVFLPVEEADQPPGSASDRKHNGSNRQ